MRPKYIDIPEYWDELSQKQFEYLLKSIFKMMASRKIKQIDVLTDFADYLCGRLRPGHPVRKEDYLILLNTIASKLSWIFIEEDNAIRVNFCTTTNLIPRFKKLRGPLSHGSDFRFGEYRTAVEMFNLYTSTQDIKFLNALVGILYRYENSGIKEDGFNGDYRIPFNKFHIERYANNVNHLHEYQKWGVYLWFSYFCIYLMSYDFIIEGNTVNFSRIFGRENVDSDTRKEPSLGMTSILFSLADTGTFGDVEKTDKAMLFDVMLKLLHDKNQIDHLNKKK